MPPTVAEAITHGRRAIRQLEPEILADLLRSYEQVWWQTERTIMQFEGQIQAAIDAGQTVRPSWVRQQTWYRQVQASIDDQFVRFNHTALSTIVRGQSQAVGIAGESTALFRQAVGIETSLAGRVNVGAFERWVSAVQPNSPIRGVIEKYGPRLERIIVDKISEGIGAGQGVGGIVRNIERAAGPDAVGGRLQTVVRTETLRAYRGSSADQYDAMPKDVVVGYRWISARDSRTCILCLSQDGRVTKTYPMTQHVSCRCTVAPVANPILVPQQGRPRETGREWFERQPENVKRQIMPTNVHYQLYQQGRPISDFVGMKHNRIWGDSISLRPASTLQAGGR